MDADTVEALRARVAELEEALAHERKWLLLNAEKSNRDEQRIAELEADRDRRKGTLWLTLRPDDSAGWCGSAYGTEIAATMCADKGARIIPVEVDL